MELPDALGEKIYNVKRELEGFERRHEDAIALGAITAIGGAIGIGAEAAALKLAERPTTIKNALGRSSLHAVAATSAFIVGYAYSQA